MMSDSSIPQSVYGFLQWMLLALCCLNPVVYAPSSCSNWWIHIRYCDYPRVSSNVLSLMLTATSMNTLPDVYNFHRQFIPPNICRMNALVCQAAFSKRCLSSQQEPVSSLLPESVNHLFDRLSSPKNSNHLLLWFLLWVLFNQDPRLAVPSVSIPWSWFINISLIKALIFIILYFLCYGK
jgi:hypothetical protein